MTDCRLDSCSNRSSRLSVLLRLFNCSSAALAIVAPWRKLSTISGRKRSIRASRGRPFQSASGLFVIGMGIAEAAPFGLGALFVVTLDETDAPSDGGVLYPSLPSG